MKVPSNPDKATIAKARAVLADPAVRWAISVRLAARRARWLKGRERYVRRAEFDRLLKKLASLEAKLAKMAKRAAR